MFALLLRVRLAPALGEGNFEPKLKLERRARVESSVSSYGLGVTIAGEASEKTSTGVISVMGVAGVVIMSLGGSAGSVSQLPVVEDEEVKEGPASLSSMLASELIGAENSELDPAEDILDELPEPDGRVVAAGMSKNPKMLPREVGSNVDDTVIDDLCLLCLPPTLMLPRLAARV